MGVIWPVPYLCQIEVKTSKNKHTQTKPNKRWKIMGVKFGEIDSGQILDNEFRLRILEKILEGLMNSNPTLVGPSQGQVEDIKRSIVSDLQKKYPNSGISYKEA